MKLGYLAMQTRHPDKWRKFSDAVLGLPTVDNGDGGFGLQLDGARQRLMIEPGPRDDVKAVGLEFADDAALDGFQQKLSAAAIISQAGSAELAAARGVRRLIGFDDPSGIRLEAFVDPTPAAQAFASAFFPLGFHTEQTGFGHVVLVARDLDVSERFYCDVMGFAVTERLAIKIGPIAVRGIFLHSNRRHHSLALFSVPTRQRLHHFMLQTNQFRDVGMAYERFQRHGVKFNLGLGQHPDPDSTFSFYAVTPSGFAIEIGAAGHEIDPVGWQERPLSAMSAWGHKPTLRAKLGMIGNFVANRIGLH